MINKKKFFCMVITTLSFVLCSCSSEPTQEKLNVEEIVQNEELSYKKENFEINNINLNEPEKLSSDNEYLYICDTGNDRIVKCDFNGDSVTKIGCLGSDKGEFNSPSCISVNNDKMCVYDFGNKRIQLLTKNGEYISEYSIGDNFSSAARIIDIEIDENDIIYFSLISYDKHIDEAGLYVFSDNKATLLKPMLIGNLGKNFNSSELYYVSKYEMKSATEWTTGYAEFGNIIEKKLDLKKGFSSMYSSIDVVYTDNNIYVYNDCGQSLDEFDSSGEYKRTVFKEEIENNYKYSGFCSDFQGNFYLSDKNNNVIYILKPINKEEKN